MAHKILTWCVLILQGTLVEASDATTTNPLDPPRKPSESYRWSFLEESFSSGVLRVSRSDTAVGAYEIDCSLEADEDAEGEGPHVRALDVPAHPNPVIVAECGIGAHSRQVLIFDPLQDSKEPVLRLTGAFVASAHENGERLRLEHDIACGECESGFELLAESWPPRDEAGLPPTSMQPDALVRLFYDEDLGILFFSDDPEYATRLFSRELRRILHEIEPDPYPGALDFDPVVNGQDASLTRIRIAPATVEGRTATVDVSFKNFDTPVELTYYLVLETGAWRLDDIRSADWSLRSLLTAP